MLGPWIDRIADTRVADVPVGKGFLYTLTLGILDGIVGPLEAINVNPIISGGAVAWVVRNLKPVRNFLGNTGAEVFAISAIRTALDHQFDLSQTVRSQTRNLMFKLGAKQKGVAVEETAVSGGVGEAASAGSFAAPIGEIAESVGEIGAPSYQTSVQRKLTGIRLKS